VWVLERLLLEVRRFLAVLRRDVVVGQVLHKLLSSERRIEPEQLAEPWKCDRTYMTKAYLRRTSVTNQERS
jgi:hypothetical protein